MPASHNSESNPKENSRFLAPLTPGTFSSTVPVNNLKANRDKSKLIMWIDKATRNKKQEKAITIRGRWIERLFGFEYTQFEMQQIKKINSALKTNQVEIDGFVSWVDRGKFLLLPTQTTNSIYIICTMIDGLEFPPNHQFVHCKGRWAYASGTSFYKVLVVEDINPVKPDYGQFRSDIKSSEFRKCLFENWRNIDPIQQNFLAQYFISSPSSPNRVGGITVSLFSAPRELKAAKILYRDLRMSVAPELLDLKKMIFDIPELNRTHKLIPFNWSEKSSDFNNISEDMQKSLTRKQHSQSIFEQSIALLSKNHKPENFQSLGLVKSDYPVTIEEHVERRGSPYADFKMTQFIVAAHLNSPCIEQKTYDEALVYARNEIKEFVDEKRDLASQILGPNGMLNLDFDGKPTSILNLAISRQRLLDADTVDKNAVIATTDDYVKNLNLAFKLWDEKTTGGVLNPYGNQLNPDEEKVLVFLYKEGPRTFDEIRTATGLSHDVCHKTIDYLHHRAVLIYQHSQTKYDTIHRRFR